MSSPVLVSIRRSAVIVAAVAGPLLLAVRFALVYRDTAAFPHRRPPRYTPDDFGLAFAEVTVTSDGGQLPAWFIPAAGGRPGPGVVLVHGWDSARDRTLPHAAFLVAAGFHCLTFDVRGNGANPAELLPVTSGEFGRDAAAAAETMLARPEVTQVAVLGHSIGGAGAVLAAAADPRIAAVVTVAAPSDVRGMIRQTFRLARLPFPEPIAAALAWLTTAVVLRPRGHSPRSISARDAVARYDGPLLIVHARDDGVMPVRHAARIAEAARAARAARGRASGSGASGSGASDRRRADDRHRADEPKPVRVLILDGGGHSWSYEIESYRRGVAAFLAEAFGGPLSPAEAADRAAAVDARRLPEPEPSLVGDRRTRAAHALIGRPPAASGDLSVGGDDEALSRVAMEVRHG